MAKNPLFEPFVLKEKEYKSDRAPGIDKRLHPWFESSSPEGRSKYAPESKTISTKARINMGIWNAFVDYLAVLGLKGDSEKVALGKNNHLYMAEIELPDGTRQLATFNTDTKIVEAGNAIPNGSGDWRFVPYDLTKASDECGRVIYLALFPELLKDEEAEETFKVLSDLYIKDDIENATAGNAACRLSDNFFRRIESDVFSVKLTASGNVREVKRAKIKTGAYVPEEIIGGHFKVFATKEDSALPEDKKMTIKEAREFYGKFNESRQWTPKELALKKALEAEVPDEEILTPEAKDMLDYIVGSTGFKNPIRNFMLRGMTGLGKSHICAQIARALDTVLVRVNCNPHMETNDFLSKFVPDTGAMDYDVFEVVDYPTLDEINYDPVTAYKKLTGIYNEKATPQMAFEAYINAQRAEAVRQVVKTESGMPRFKLVKSDFVLALEKGYVVEIEEPSIILNSGVLGGLNEYNRPGSIVPMPDGTYIVRSDKAIVIYTDNVCYEGCRPINQAVNRRTFEAIDMYTMDKEDVLERVKLMSGFEDDETLELMYQVWDSIQQYCQTNSITSGSCSVVELSNWAEGVRIKGLKKLRDVCLGTVVRKATPIPSEQEDIIAACVDARL